jgi:hypothetical protein
MKAKQLLNFVLLLISFHSYSQDASDLEKNIRNSYVDQLDFFLYSAKDSEKFENLKFIEYVKLDKSKFEFAKILIPKLVIIDTKQGDDPKKNKKRIDFLQRYGIGSLEGQKNWNYITGLQWAENLKFDFNNSNYIIWGNSVSNAINVSENLFKTYQFEDTVIAKYKGETSDKFYYIIKIDEFYGIVYENEYNKSVSEKEVLYEEAKEQIAKIEKGKLRGESEKWMGGNFTKIFPDEKIYMYDVSYFYKGSRNEGEKTVEFKVNALALSNISPVSISEEDFTRTTKLNFISYKYIKDYNVLDLLVNKTTQLDSLFYIKQGPGYYYEGWKKGVNIDPILDLEKDAILGGDKNISKYSPDYFLKKIQNKDVFGKRPLFLTAEYGNDGFIRFKMLETISIGAGKDFFGVYVSKNIWIEGFAEGLRRSFDTRVDQPNFNFVTIDSGFFDDFATNHTASFALQTNKENIEQLIAHKNSKNITYFYEYLKETKNKNNEDDQNKQIIINKYGAKYTNEALNGNIIVGMPEGLLPIPLRLWEITSRSRWNKGYKIYCKSLLDSSVRLSVHVQNGKVTYVSF